MSETKNASHDEPLLLRMYDTLGLKRQVATVAIRFVREHDAGTAIHIEGMIPEPSTDAITELATKVRALKQPHVHCDDSYYCCPQCTVADCMGRGANKECDCGKTKRDAAIEEIAQEVGRLQEERNYQHQKAVDLLGQNGRLRSELQEMHRAAAR